MLRVFSSNRSRLPRSNTRPVWRGRRHRHRFWTVPGWLKVLLAVTIVAVTASAACWLVAGGQPDQLPLSASFGVRPVNAASPPDGAPVLIESTPSGAEVLIDGTNRGVAPVQLSLSPGSHNLQVRQTDFMEVLKYVDVPLAGTSVSVDLWRRQPVIVPLRTVYPGARLLDVRFLNAGQLALTVNSSAGPGLSQANTGDELWELDPTSGSLDRRALASGSTLQVSAVASSPDGQQVAYASGAQAISSSLWPVRSSAHATEATAQSASPSVRVVSTDGNSNPVSVFELDRKAAAAAATAEYITDLVWTPHGQRLVIVTRTDSTPARGRLVLVDLGSGADDATPAELAVMPAEILPGSAAVDPTGQWLAFAARATTASNAANVVTLCVVELRSGGTLRDIAELGPAQRLPSPVPLAWASAPASGTTSRLAFMAPVLAPSSGSGTGLFDIFGALRPPATPSGLFVLDLNHTGGISQPRRIGTVTGIGAPVWRDASTIYGFSRRDDGSLSLRSIDVPSGTVHDTGGVIPAGTVQGSGLSARWDVVHGRALLLTHPATGSTGQSAAGLQAWLVSFLSSSSEVQP